MNIKNQKLIVRVGHKEREMIDDMKKNYDINLSSLIRRLLTDFYKELKSEKEKVGHLCDS